MDYANVLVNRIDINNLQHFNLFELHFYICTVASIMYY